MSEEPVITAISSKVAEAEKADNDNISIIELKPTIQRKIFLVVRNISDTPQTLKLFLDFTYQWLTTQTALEQAKNALISSVLKSKKLLLPQLMDGKASYDMIALSGY